jgi:ElaA protein
MEFAVKRFEELTLEELYEILRLRVDVFVVEQDCPYPEIDGIDYDSIHVFSMENGRVTAYLRYYESDVCMRIGRVIAAERGKGHGKELMTKGIDLIRTTTDADRIVLGAQVVAMGFYESLGFRACSEPYDEDGIMHITMSLQLNKEK